METQHHFEFDNYIYVPQQKESRFKHVDIVIIYMLGLLPSTFILLVALLVVAPINTVTSTYFTYPMYSYAGISYVLVIAFTIHKMLSHLKTKRYQPHIYEPSLILFLNRIVELENGALVPMYKFINYSETTPEVLVIDIDDRMIQHFDNHIIKPSNNKSIGLINYKVKIARNRYEKLDGYELVRFISQHAELFERTLKTDTLNLDSMMSKNYELETKEYEKKSYFKEQLLALKNGVNVRRIETSKELKKLNDDFEMIYSRYDRKRG